MAEFRPRTGARWPPDRARFLGMSVPPSADTDVPDTPDGPEPPDTAVVGDRLVVMAAEPDERGPQDFPSRSDGFVRGLAEAIGGPIGQHAAGRNTPGGIRHRFWSAARIVLALTCLTLVMHYVQKSPCRD